MKARVPTSQPLSWESLREGFVPLKVVAAEVERYITYRRKEETARCEFEAEAAAVWLKKLAGVSSP